MLTEEELLWCGRAKALNPRECKEDLKSFADMAADWAKIRFERRAKTPIEEFFTRTEARNVAVKVVKVTRVVRPFALMLLATNSIAGSAWEIYCERRRGQAP